MAVRAQKRNNPEIEEVFTDVVWENMEKHNKTKGWRIIERLAEPVMDAPIDASIVKHIEISDVIVEQPKKTKKNHTQKK